MINAVVEKDQIISTPAAPRRERRQHKVVPDHRVKMQRLGDIFDDIFTQTDEEKKLKWRQKLTESEYL